MASALLQSLGGLGSMGGLSNPLASLAPKDPKEAGIGTIRDFLKGGTEIGWWGLFFLAGAIPFQPFATLGYAGMNLLAGGSAASAAAKFALHGITKLANTFLTTYYPSLWLYGMATLVSPWYVFDLVQMFSPKFEAEGFKIPFTKKSVAGVGAKGKITLTNAPVMLGILALGSYWMLQYLDPRLIKAAKPTLEMIAIAIGSLSALAAGGVGTMLAFPGILSSIQAGSGALTAALKEEPAASGAAGGAPAAAPSGPAQAGGATGNPGSSIPSLREVANGMLGPNPAGDSSAYRSGVLSGGGADADGPSSTGSLLFLGGLGIAALTGISVAVTRSKAATSA